MKTTYQIKVDLIDRSGMEDYHYTEIAAETESLRLARKIADMVERAGKYERGVVTEVTIVEVIEDEEGMVYEFPPDPEELGDF